MNQLSELGGLPGGSELSQRVLAKGDAKRTPALVVGVPDEHHSEYYYSLG